MNENLRNKDAKMAMPPFVNCTLVTLFASLTLSNAVSAQDAKICEVIDGETAASQMLQVPLEDNGLPVDRAVGEGILDRNEVDAIREQVQYDKFYNCTNKAGASFLSIKGVGGVPVLFNIPAPTQKVS